MKPRTKPEPRVQIKLSVAKSVADACEAARKEAAETPFDWNATMAEKIEKENAEFREFLAQYKAKSQPNAGLEISPINGADPDQHDPEIQRTSET
jgi:hypothetical protein